MTANIILLAVVGLFVILAVKKIVSERKKGKNSCGCSACSASCPACSDAGNKLKANTHHEFESQNDADRYPVNKSTQ